MREDVYAVFIQVQDEQHAQSADYAKFAESIHTAIRNQLERRDKIDAHLAEKARRYNDSRNAFDANENNEGRKILESAQS